MWDPRHAQNNECGACSCTGWSRARANRTPLLLTTSKRSGCSMPTSALSSRRGLSHRRASRISASVHSSPLIILSLDLVLYLESRFDPVLYAWGHLLASLYIAKAPVYHTLYAIRTQHVRSLCSPTCAALVQCRDVLKCFPCHLPVSLLHV